MKCLIVEDDLVALRTVEEYVRKSNSFKDIVSCSSGSEANNLLNAEDYDVVFLDVEVPELNGLEILESLKNSHRVVLMSSEEKYAVKAFDYEVADFLVKPISYSRFVKSLNKLNSSKSDKLSINNQSIFVKSNNQLVQVYYNEIIWIQAMSDYVVLHTEDKKYTVLSTMKALEKNLPSDKFLRSHRSYIVNIDKVTSIDDTTIILGSQFIPLGKTYRSNFLDKLNTI